MYGPEKPLPDCPEFEEILDGVTLEEFAAMEDNLETHQQHSENWEADLITRAKEADEEEEPDETENIPAPAKVSPLELGETQKFCSTG